VSRSRSASNDSRGSFVSRSRSVSEDNNEIK